MLVPKADTPVPLMKSHFFARDVFLVFWLIEPGHIEKIVPLYIGHENPLFALRSIPISHG